MKKNFQLDFYKKFFFLQESLEEEAQSLENQTTTPALDDLQQRLAFLERQILQLWQQLDLQAPQPLLLDELQSKLNARRYLTRLQERTTANLS